MNLPPETAARIAAALATLGDHTLPDSTGQRLGALPLYAGDDGAVLLRPDGVFLELAWGQASELVPLELETPTWPVVLHAAAVRYRWLNALLPDRPYNAPNCRACGGVARVADAESSTGYVFCGACQGAGWIAPAV